MRIRGSSSSRAAHAPAGPCLTRALCRPACRVPGTLSASVPSRLGFAGASSPSSGAVDASDMLREHRRGRAALASAGNNPTRSTDIPRVNIYLSTWVGAWRIRLYLIIFSISVIR